jgi:protein-S-isoprenylcysteine O-methyltransferase Ste14
MSTEPQRTCPSCGNEFSGAMEFCPVCMLRKVLAEGIESRESSFPSLHHLPASAITSHTMSDDLPIGDRRSLRFALRHYFNIVGSYAFAHRLLLGLGVVVIAGFFVQPTLPGSARIVLLKMISVAVVLAGVVLRAWAAGCAGRHTRTSNIQAEKLATGGPYAFVRNPIYLGSIVIGVGMVGVVGDWRLLPLCGGTFAALYFFIVPAEEKFLSGRYSMRYSVYRANVPRFLPRFTPWTGAEQTSFDWHPALREWQMMIVLISILAFIFGAAVLRGAAVFAQ